MMIVLVFIIAIIFLFLGHYYKIIRWKLFISVYERPKERSLFRSLSIGYLINFFLPLHIGDVIRAYLAGKRMKNGFGFSLATVFVDRFLDILIVGLFFLIFSLIGFQSEIISDSILFYTNLSILLILFFFVTKFFSKFLKRLARGICSIFNTRIELSLLFFCWSVISSFKNIKTVSIFKLTGTTLVMWFSYFASYYLLGIFITSFLGVEMSFFQVFSELYSNSTIVTSTLKGNINANLLSNSLIIVLSLFHILPILFLFLVSYLPVKFFKYVRKDISPETIEYVNLIPYINEKDKLNFLETYFSDNKRDFLNQFIAINRDISIIQDFTAGSNATTMLCMDEKDIFYRKYSFGKESAKLFEQIKWINEFKNKIPLSEILRIHSEDVFCLYDMKYRNSAVGMFNFIHSTPINKSWGVLLQMIEDLNLSLYVDEISSDPETIINYIDNKVITNLNKIKEGKDISALLDYDILIINGRSYKNIRILEKFFKKELFIEVFSKDLITNVHGDLTIENIICETDPISSKDYYIIDPNVGNILNSRYLDYAKIFQSLHGGYEFLANTHYYNILGNKIDFVDSKSLVYNELYVNFVKYLENNFGRDGLKSVYFHEIVHWLRLMPYKLEQLNKNAIIFYSGLIIVMNDVMNLCESKQL